MKVNWAKIGGLLPVVVQDSATREVLMMAYMDENALKLTLESGFAHYFSRTKGRIWKKGEESGNVQKVVSATLDCDEDSLLLEVEQTGVACHTGARSCFFNQISNLNGNSNLKDEKPSSNLNKPKYGILDELYHVALERKLAGDPEKSYVAKLYHKGENAYLKKICEEAGELSFAVKDLLKALEIVDNSNLNAENLVREAGQLREARGFGAASTERKDGLSSSAQLKASPNAILSRFGEHRPGDPAYDVVYEAADLVFHLIVALAACDIHPERVLAELERREGVSGIEEKNARPK